MTVSLELLAQIRGTLSKTVDDRGASTSVNERALIEYDNGTGANQANAVYIKDFSIAASGTLNTDLASSLTDDLGTTVVFTAVKAVMVQAASTNTNNVIMGNGTNPFIGPFDDGTATVTLKPGGLFMVADGSAAGWTVAAGTGDVLKLANSAAGTTVTGTLVVIGEA